MIFYTLSVVYDNKKMSLNRATKRLIRNACVCCGLRHERPGEASKAAQRLSGLKGVDRVVITRIDENHVVTWRKGRKT
jgi:hypothetical protein